MTDTIAHPPLPAPAGHVFTHTMEAFAKVDCHGHIYSLPQSDPVYGSTVPLYTAQQMREYRDAPAWQPIETAPMDGTAILAMLPDPDLPHAVMWSIKYGCWCMARDHYFLVGPDAPSHWMPLPAAPIEQATGEAP